jgi:hypothetical protein
VCEREREQLLHQLDLVRAHARELQIQVRAAGCWLLLCLLSAAAAAVCCWCCGRTPGSCRCRCALLAGCCCSLLSAICCLRSAAPTAAGASPPAQPVARVLRTSHSQGLRGSHAASIAPYPRIRLCLTKEAIPWLDLGLIRSHCLFPPIPSPSLPASLPPLRALAPDCRAQAGADVDTYPDGAAEGAEGYSPFKTRPFGSTGRHSGSTGTSPYSQSSDARTSDADARISDGDARTSDGVRTPERSDGGESAGGDEGAERTHRRSSRPAISYNSRRARSTGAESANGGSGQEEDSHPSPSAVVMRSPPQRSTAARAGAGAQTLPRARLSPSLRALSRSPQSEPAAVRSSQQSVPLSLRLASPPYRELALSGRSVAGSSHEHGACSAAASSHEHGVWGSAAHVPSARSAELSEAAPQRAHAPASPLPSSEHLGRWLASEEQQHSAPLADSSHAAAHCASVREAVLAQALADAEAAELELRALRSSPHTVGSSMHAVGSPRAVGSAGILAASDGAQTRTVGEQVRGAREREG